MAKLVQLKNLEDLHTIKAGCKLYCRMPDEIIHAGNEYNIDDLTHDVYEIDRDFPKTDILVHCNLKVKNRDETLTTSIIVGDQLLDGRWYKIQDL